MTKRIILFAFRNPELSPREFQDYIVQHHVKLLKSLTGATFPLQWIEHFPARISSGVGERAGLAHLSPKVGDPNAPVVLIGTPEDIEWDGMVEMVFKDELHFQQFFALINEPEIADKISADEEKFCDSSRLKAVVIGESRTWNTD